MKVYLMEVVLNPTIPNSTAVACAHAHMHTRTCTYTPGQCVPGICFKTQLPTIAGHDSPLVNNYGVWIDEARSLGLEHTLDKSWEDAVCYFEEGQKVCVVVGVTWCVCGI